MSPPILIFYEYVKLSTAAYVILDAQPLDGATIARRANAQDRVPTALAERAFIEGPAHSPNPWTISGGGYHGNDGTGFAAILFERGRGRPPRTLSGAIVDVCRSLSQRRAAISLGLKL